jgi:6-phosphogluconolactonase
VNTIRDDARGTLLVYETPSDVAKTLADFFIEHAKDAIEARGRFVVALAGGTTPKATYSLFTRAPYCDAIDWDAVQLLFGDERCVPPDNDQSNYKMAYESFIKPMGIADEQVHRMRGEDDPQQAALSYRRVLLDVFGEAPSFDLVMLGMGPDGHTASLFPGEDPLTADEERVRAVYATSHDQWRLTLTPSVLNASFAVAFAVTGADKAAALRAVYDGPRNPTQYPAQIIEPPNESTFVWLVDKAAAGKS